MLVLRRSVGETIELHVDGQVIVISIEEVRGKVAKVGVNAPDQVIILRGELTKASQPNSEVSNGKSS